MSMKQSKRDTIHIRENVSGYLDLYNFTVDNLRDIISRFEQQNGSGWEISLEFETSTGYYDSVDKELYINACRFETDEEYETRLADEEQKRKRAAVNARKSREARKKAEYETYLKLKEKYENK